MKKRAFTMIELIVILVVIGIIAAYSIPRFKRDTRAEAINHILSMIRYTQNLALHDSKHQIDKPKWQRAFWRFEIYNCANKSGIFYKIGTDKDLNGGLNRSETAIDRSNGKFTFWDTRKACPKNSQDALMNEVSPNIFLTQRYGIKSATFNSCKVYKNGVKTSSTKHIGFDKFGRPYKSYGFSIQPSYWGKTLNDCKITFSFVDSSISPFTIVVKPETDSK
jgi:prepilin-type N-terminal cleavage/methylation domain-containing protein